MRALVALLAALFVTAAFPANACSVTRPLAKFVPDQEAFESAHDFYVALDVPAPVVKVRELVRASAMVAGSCRSLTWVTLEVSVPPGSPFSLEELGFLFRAPNGPEQDRFMAFPNFPIVSSEFTHDGEASVFAFALTDPPETRDSPFSLQLEVLAINGGLQIGPPSLVHIGKF
ncbi:hypothetical protein H0E84_15635 [Luteimonas sp. SJ-92]|uniref:Lipoprotein n=1 Tax=Luteimonas salinisoli TaxID=2752307 RepID=A0A853JH94_9GAMM|nr:hypothetical protein [Luteimonas salinisoli]NZA27810.1 hypothetical protein [Luteimonas salinisoli]